MANNDFEKGRRDIVIDSLSDFNDEFIKSKSRGTNKINISFDLNIYDFEVGRKIYAFIMDVKEKGYDVSVSIKTENHIFSFDNKKYFTQLKDAFLNNGINFNYDGGIGKDYSIEEVYLAQTRLKELVTRIELANLSPFEKYLYLYDFLIGKIYKDNKDDASKSRDIIAVMTGDYIVCSGYAKLMERICKEVGIPCKTQKCSVTNKKGEKYNHENNIVRIDDDKYNIHGWFYSDACWDHVDAKTPDKKTYAFCLIPLKDKDKMKNNKITVNDDSLFYYDDPDNKFKLIDGEYYGSTFGIDYQNGEYSRSIKDFDLETKYKIEEDKVKFIYNSFIRANALERLRKIMQKNGIPSDVYSKKSEVPYGCSLEFLTALSMQRGNDFLVNEKVRELKAFYDSDKTLPFEDSARSYTENVYDEINSLIDSADDFKNDFRWQCIDQKLVKIAMADKVEVCLKDENSEPGKPISYDSFKKGLLRVYSQKLITSNNPIMSMVNEIMDETTKISEKIYDDAATNCFREKALYDELYEKEQ